MDVSRELTESLARHMTDGPLLSIYLPTTLEVEERQQNGIRLKNLLKDARARLEALGMAATDADFLTQAVGNASLDREMWKAHGQGFAIFAGRQFLEHVSLPLPVRELVVAGFRFHLKPLIEALSRRRKYWLLALSQNDVRLYAGDDQALAEVDPGPEAPRSLTDVTGHEPAGKQLHYHSGDRGGEVAIYHGLGAGKDDTDAELAQFLRAVEAGLERFWKLGDAPVVVAADDQIRGLYRRLSRQPERILGEIDGNVEHLSKQDLHSRSWPMVLDELARRRKDELARLVQSGAGTPVSRELADVLRAAADGRVDTLFIAADVECWGSFGDGERAIDTHQAPLPGDDDLLDRAAVDSWLKGAAVYAIPASEIPGKGLAIAGLRY